ncbi:MAG: hypothetical protein PVG69_07315 [Desulfobacterales bacterium]|jgi:hypothetical protein
MKGRFKMQDEKTVWYENYEPVQEYLDREFSKKSTVAEKEPKTMRFSWLEIMKKSFHIK